LPVTVHDVDLDSQFALPSEHYDLVFLLGILYHLKNPFYVLEALSHRADRLLLSTRVARYAGDSIGIRELCVAYLLDPHEANNDATNYWIFSEAGLSRLISRTGWVIEEYLTVGDTERSNPASNEHDERAYALLRSTRA
jgi:hypothetical protein